jgi:2-hydroxychromene-2-carboxylate isomerase
MGGVVDFWFDFASTYSYPAAMRIEPLAKAQGVRLNWRPFLLGPLFATQGWRTSPFNLYPAKGRYMWRDLERICAAENLALRQPDPFPQNSLLAARCALAIEERRRADFVKAVFSAEFSAGLRIDDPAGLATVLASLDLPQGILGEAISQPVKQKLRSETEEAQRLGLFGAPTCVTAGEIFWGNDRLEQAIAWAAAES